MEVPLMRKHTIATAQRKAAANRVLMGQYKDLAHTAPTQLLMDYYQGQAATAKTAWHFYCGVAFGLGGRMEPDLVGVVDERTPYAFHNGRKQGREQRDRDECARVGRMAVAS